MNKKDENPSEQELIQLYEKLQKTMGEEKKKDAKKEEKEFHSLIQKIKREGIPIKVTLTAALILVVLVGLEMTMPQV